MKDSILYIIHIHECLEKIRLYTQTGREVFLNDTKTQDTVIRNFEVIGEATKRVSTELILRYSEIPWRKMAGFRDFLIHAYDRVSMEEVWKIIERDVSKLVVQIKYLRDQLLNKNS